MEIKLQQLTMRNFKGIPDLSLDFDGKDTSIYGSNGTGKSTIYDAWLWLMTGKDSAGNADPAIKPVNKYGDIIDHAAHSSVSAEILADGQKVTLCRDYFERWSKKRGNPDATYDGNTTEFYINGVPKSKGDYEKALEKLIPLDKFRLLSDVFAFGRLQWQKRREILFEMADVGTDLELMAGNDTYAPLLEAAAPIGLDDLRAQLKARRKKLNARMNDLPVMIAENRKVEQELGDAPFDVLRASLSDLDVDDQRISREIAAVERGDTEALEAQATARRLEIQAIDMENQDFRRKLEAAGSERREAEREVDRLKREVDRATDDYRRTSKQYHSAKELAARHAAHAEEYRSMWREESAKSFTASGVCPTCGQPLPAEKIAEAKAAWETSRRETLEQIQRLGASAAESATQMQQTVIQLQQDMADIESIIARRKDELSAAEARCSTISAPAVVDMPDYVSRRSVAQKRLEDALKQMDGEQDAYMQTVNALREKRQAVRSEMQAIRGQLAKEDTLISVRDRIKELEDERKKLADELADVDRLTDLAEDFVRYKTQYITDAVNRRFRFARFRLFTEQINGGLKDCCDITYNGVPYDYGLNNGARINVGLDIVRTLSEHYGCTAPVFVDNAESVVDVEGIDSQTIRLIVSAQDEKVRVEAA